MRFLVFVFLLFLMISTMHRCAPFLPVRLMHHGQFRQVAGIVFCPSTRGHFTDSARRHFTQHASRAGGTAALTHFGDFWTPRSASLSPNFVATIASSNNTMVRKFRAAVHLGLLLLLLFNYSLGSPSSSGNTFTIEIITQPNDGR